MGNKHEEENGSEMSKGKFIGERERESERGIGMEMGN